MPSPNNVIIASAGSRKTTSIIEDTLDNTDKRILITTYTNENLDQITSYIVDKKGCIPSNITVLSWFSFLLRDGVRPYQNYLLIQERVKSIDYDSKPNLYTPREDQDYYINAEGNIYRDRVSDFVCHCNIACGGLIINRLQDVYDLIYIDEVQDLSGWDQDFVESIMRSSSIITLVGDPRQATYSTNNSRKNRAHHGNKMIHWVEDLSKKGLCCVIEKNECYRCNQHICDFADELYPDLKRTKSFNTDTTGHDGVFFIKFDDVMDYVARFNPKVLRWDKRANTMNLPALNFGASKGLTFDRVLIFPTNPIKKYIKTKDISQAGDISKLYVAITRAKFSVAFVID